MRERSSGFIGLKAKVARQVVLVLGNQRKNGWCVKGSEQRFAMFLPCLGAMMGGVLFHG